MIIRMTKIAVAAALISGLALTHPILAQKANTAATEETPAAKKMQRRSYKGTIESIDAAAKTVTIKKATTTKKFKIAENAKFVTTFNSNATVAELKQGDVVNVRWSDEGDTPVAHYIAHAAKKLGVVDFG